MNFLQAWILMKVLIILLFFSGLFGIIRYFVHPDMSHIAMVISVSACFTGGVMCFLIFRMERRLSKKYKDLDINFWDPWQDVGE